MDTRRTTRSSRLYDVAPEISSDDEAQGSCVGISAAEKIETSPKKETNGDSDRFFTLDWAVVVDAMVPIPTGTRISMTRDLKTVITGRNFEDSQDHNASQNTADGRRHFRAVHPRIRAMAHLFRRRAQDER